MADWISTEAAADLFDTTASNLSQYNPRLSHVAVRLAATRPFGRSGPLAWPEFVIRAAVAYRKKHGCGVATAIEAVAGKVTKD
jgi:hypothetical protein